MVNFEKTSNIPTPSKSCEDPTEYSESEATPNRSTFSPSSIESQTPLKLIVPKKLSFNENSNSEAKNENQLQKIRQNKFDPPNCPFSSRDKLQRNYGEPNGPMASNNKRTLDNEKHNKNNKRNKVYKAHREDFQVNHKTELCKNFQEGYCAYGDKCAFSHGLDDLRPKVKNSISYKSKNCRGFFGNGYCCYGSRCNFAHELSSNILNNPNEINKTYERRLNVLSKPENVRNINELSGKRRLDVFNEICKIEGSETENQNQTSRLFSDIIKLVNNDLLKDYGKESDDEI